MHPITFCTHCRGMRKGWNVQYLRHCVMCQEWVLRSIKLLIISILPVSLIWTFPIAVEIAYSDLEPGRAVDQAGLLPVPDRVQASMEQLLTEYEAGKSHRTRVAKAIAVSSRKHDVDPRLLTSIMIVESRGNPFAISRADAVGIMQVHMGTWGEEADREGVNLFKIEDNVDFGAKILKGYVERHGLWGGVRRYKGWTDAPGSREEADQYVQKVQRIYSSSLPTS